MLDIVIDLVNQKTGGSTKFINQRDNFDENEDVKLRYYATIAVEDSCQW